MSGFFSAIRRRLLALFTLFLSHIPASLLIGIVFGIKIQTPQVFGDAIQKAGLTHIIAASGMNVTMVATGVSTLVKRFSHRKGGLVLTLLAILFYLFLCGFQASIVRVAIMGSLAIIASLLGRQYTGLWTVLVTGWVMLLISPQTITDVGFQLSFFATLGFLTIKPLLDRLFSKIKSPVIEDLTTTSAAQLATIPILLSAFGQFNLLSLVANTLVLWMIPIRMVVGSVGAILGLVIPVLSIPFFLLCLPLLLFMIAVIQLFGTHGVSLTVATVPITFMIGYYLIMGAIIWHMTKRNADEKI